MPPGSQCVQVSSSVFNQCVGIKEGSCEYTIMCVGIKEGSCEYTIMSSVSTSLQVSKSLLVSSIGVSLQVSKSLLVSSVSNSQTHKEPTQCDNVRPFKCQVSFSVFSQCVPSTHKINNILPNVTMCVPSSVKSLLVSSVSVSPHRSMQGCRIVLCVQAALLGNTLTK